MRVVRRAGPSGFAETEGKSRPDQRNAEKGVKMLLCRVEDFRGAGTSLLPGAPSEWREGPELGAGRWFCGHIRARCFLILFSLVLSSPSAAVCSLVYDLLLVLGL